MNNKILIGIIALIVGAGVLLLITNSANKQTTPQPTITPSQPSVTALPTNQASESATIAITGSGFSPSTLTVKTGIKVTWVNKSGAIANISSDPHPVHTAYPPLNLGNFNDGESVSLTFDKTGTYTYHNHLNPNQTGTVVVE
ncbi:MAG: cupredoxin domain-containing protein [bacterium]|nr:cupredoxin domain-containing protein [bacterium]